MLFSGTDRLLDAVFNLLAYASNSINIIICNSYSEFYDYTLTYEVFVKYTYARSIITIIIYKEWNMISAYPADIFWRVIE